MWIGELITEKKVGNGISLLIFAGIVSGLPQALQQVIGLLGEAERRGVEVSDPKLGSDRSWQAWLADPDGTRIELHGYTPDSSQAPSLG